MAELDAGTLQRWLVSDEVVEADGSVWSWRGSGGFRYPEAGGLWLSWIAIADPRDQRAPLVARWLERAVIDGNVGRDGIGYTFDLGIVLAGLLRWCEASSAPISSRIAARASELVAAIADRRAVTTVIAPPRWSTQFGPHQRKLAITLDRIDGLGLADTSRARAQLVVMGEAEIAARDPKNSLSADPIYVHAAAYALEGAWSLGAIDTLARGASWLAEIQRTSGGVAAWWDPRRGAHGPSRADATAQAIRLWCAADRRRHASAITAGLGFLATLHDARGGVRYDDTSEDRNVWCTLFAWQALAFARGPASAELLL